MAVFFTIAATRSAWNLGTGLRSHRPHSMRLVSRLTLTMSGNSRQNFRLCRGVAMLALATAPVFAAPKPTATEKGVEPAIAAEEAGDEIGRAHV